MSEPKLTAHKIAQEISDMMPGLMLDGVFNREQVIAGEIQRLLDQERAEAERTTWRAIALGVLIGVIAAGSSAIMAFALNQARSAL